MTSLKKAAIAFNELFLDYVPTEIVEILHDHHYLTRDTAFLARCYSRLELEELIEVEQIIDAFFEEVANESIIEENLTDWQREIVIAINQVINDSTFRGLFSIRNTLTAYDDIEIASIVAEVCNSKGLLNKLTKHFYLQYRDKFKYKEIEAFIYKIFKWNINEENLLSWQQDIIRQMNELDFLNNFNLNFHDIYLYMESFEASSQDDVSDVESLLSHDEVSAGSEAIIGPSFNIPFDDNYIQGNRIHKELAGIENTYKRLFYQKRSETSDSISEKYEKYKKNNQEIQETIEEIQHKQDSIFGALYDEDTLAEQFHKAQARKDSELTDKWGDTAAYPNLATAKLSYIGKDGKLHTKSIKASDLSKSKAVQNYKARINSHAEGQVFEYVKELIEKETKYREAKKIIIDIHTKMDMCAVKAIGDYYNRDYITEGTCTQLARELTTKYPKVAIRVSYDINHYYGQKNYNYLCQPCKPANPWSYKILPTTSMLQYPIGEDFDYLEEKLDLDEIIWSTGTERHYGSSIEKVKKAHYQHRIDYYLYERNMHSVDVDPDGNCFFHAIARQFEMMNGERILTYDQIRQFAINYMLEHPGQFNGFTENSLDQYIDGMSKNGAWADNPIIQALADEFNINIDIHRIDGRITHILARLTLFNDLPPAVTLNIAYTGNHYLSAEPLANQVQDENIERLVQAMGGSSLEDSQGASSPDKHKPSAAPTSMPTSSPTDVSKSNAISYAYEGSFLSAANIGEYESHFKVLAAFLGLDDTII